jgi:DNA-binding CsgD family transcriptional regulator
MVLAVLGFLALSLDDPVAANAQLGRLADLNFAVGIGEPGVVKYLPDEIEALVALGQVDRASSLTRKLEAQGRLLGRGWALATAARCRALVATVDGDPERAMTACEQALLEQEQLPMPFELARTLLVKGMIQRRVRHPLAAGATLGQALALFERLGAPLWAGKARRELSSIATGTPADGLTEAERRIAALVAQGHTNRQVATAMFVTENTVQTHIRHIFQKLGLRSRTQLAARLLSAQADSPTGARSTPG